MKKRFSHGSVDQMIDEFENKIAELGGDIESSTKINCASEDSVGENERFIHTLIGDVENEIFDISRGTTWDQDDENLYLTLVVDDGRVLDFTIPLSDLTMDIDDIEPSVQYVADTVRYAFDHPEDEIDVEDEETVEDEDEFIDNADVESSTDIKASSSGSVLHVEFEEYDRVGGRIRKVTVRGTDRLDALYKMLDKMHCPPLDPDGIEEDDMTEDEVIENIKYNNGDGCDFIFKIEDKTTGETLLDEGVSTEEDWDEEDVDSSTTIRCSNKTWTDAYSEIEEIINQYMPHTDEVRLHVNEWYSEHQGDPAYDEAYRRFNEDPTILEAEDEYEDVESCGVVDNKETVEGGYETDIDDEDKHHLEERISEFLFKQLNYDFEDHLVAKVSLAVPEYEQVVNVRATREHWDEREDKIREAKQEYVRALLQALMEDRG